MTTGKVVSVDIVWDLFDYRNGCFDTKYVGIQLFDHENGDLCCFCLGLQDEFHPKTKNLGTDDCSEMKHTINCITVSGKSNWFWEK